MEKRIGLIRHSPLVLVAVLVVAALVACQGDEQRLRVAYGVLREEVPTRIVVVEEDGTDAERITGAQRGHPPMLPKWSPDGRRLAFVRFNPLGGPGSLQVHVVNADGSRERRVGEGTLPEWTRDGRFLVVERTAAPPKASRIRVLAVDGGRDRDVAAGSAPTLSHNGSRIAFVRYTFGRRPGVTTSSSLYTVSLDGTGLRLVARTKQRNIRWVQPQWLPGDSRISVAQRTGSVVGSGPLLAFSLNGRRQAIVPKVGETYDWSPSGDRLAYTIDGALTIAQRDGTEIETYGESNAIDIEWSPDGKKVGFSVQEILETDIQYVALYVIDVEKGERRRFVLAEGLVAYFDWEPLPPEDD